MLLYTLDKMERLLRDAFAILENAGFSIEDDGFLGECARRGMKVDPSRRRVFVPRRHCERLLAPSVDPSRGQDAAPGEPAALHVGGTYPKFYDYPRRISTPGSETAFLEMTRIFAGMPEFPEVDRILALTEVPREIEPVYATALLIKNCRKPGRGETGTAAVIPYLVELGEIVTGKAGSTHCVPPWTFLVPPLRITREESRMIRERARFCRRASGGSMISSGISAPSSREGSVSLQLAEVIAVWICYRLLDETLPLEALFATSVFDMRSGVCLFSHPGAILQDCAAAQIMRVFFGAHAEVASNYVDAKVPGIQASYEKAYKNAWVYAFLGHLDCDCGLLDAGSTFSPLQALIDRDTLTTVRALFPLPHSARQEALLQETISVLEGDGSFLDSPATAAFPGLNDLGTRLLDRTSRGADAEEQEKSGRFLEAAQERLEDLGRRAELYRAPAELCRAVDEVTARARRHLAD